MKAIDSFFLFDSNFDRMYGSIHTVLYIHTVAQLILFMISIEIIKLALISTLIVVIIGAIVYFGILRWLSLHN
jgi:hypothetical protein